MVEAGPEEGEGGGRGKKVVQEVETAWVVWARGVGGYFGKGGADGGYLNGNNFGN